MGSQVGTAKQAFRFSVALAAIYLTLYLVMYANPATFTNAAGTAFQGFLSFLPVCFYLIGQSEKQVQMRITALEDRIKALEAGRGPGATDNQP